jgi:acetyl-CoA carboxylase carboxyl transferase subunit alpha
MCDDFIELHGDRTVGDDKAIIGGLVPLPAKQ